MELREAFDIADLDKGGALELDEVSKWLALTVLFSLSRRSARLLAKT
jgi:Ca2+-binding EF-hand superfamily protein